MLKIGFSGVPGTGKTSTARGFASACRRIDSLNNVELIAEYARRFITKYGPMDIPDQFRTMQKQLEWESAVAPNIDLIVVDSPIFLGFMYMLNHDDRNTPKNTLYINDIFKLLNKLNIEKPHYDIIFHLPPVVKCIDDGVRAKEQLTDEWRNKKDAEITYICRDLFPPAKFHVIEEVELDDRVDKAINIVKEVINEVSKTK